MYNNRMEIFPNYNMNLENIHYHSISGQRVEWMIYLQMCQNQMDQGEPEWADMWQLSDVEVGPHVSTYQIYN